MPVDCGVPGGRAAVPGNFHTVRPGTHCANRFGSTPCRQFELAYEPYDRAFDCSTA